MEFCHYLYPRDFWLFFSIACLSVCLSLWLNEWLWNYSSAQEVTFIISWNGTWYILHTLGVDQKFCTKFCTVMENQQSKAIHGPKNPTWPSSWISSCSYTLDDLLLIMWYLRWQIYWLKICSNDGMFKLATRNKFNMAAATVLNFVFWGILVTNEVFLL